MATIREPARDVPVLAEADVCVLGGSCTGVFAALRAARLGARVVIVEKQNCFGGTATASLVNVWHSFYDTEYRRRIIAGLSAEVTDRLTQRGAVQHVPRNPERAVVFNSAELTIELDAMVRQAAVHPYLHTTFSAPVIEHDRVVAAIVENKSGRGAVRARVFVDATGDGDLCHRAGLPTYTRDPLQPPTTCALIEGWTSLDRAAVDAALREHAAEHGLPDGFRWGTRLPHSEVYMLAGTRVAGRDCADADELTICEMEGRRQVRAVLDIVSRHGGGAPRLLALPSHVGVRETRHVRCAYQLTGHDVLHGIHFNDAIANGSYRVDIHHQDRPGITFRYLDGREVYARPGLPGEEGRWREETEESPTFYQVPLGSLLPGGLDNVVVAGRMLDADEEAFGAVRVMVTMNQTGEAAGVLAWHALDADMSVHAVPAAAVRETLAAGGSIIL